MTLNEIYELIKSTLGLARKIRNQEIVDKIMDIQNAFFEIREENQNKNDKIRELEAKINELQGSKVLAEQLIFSPRGFITKQGESPQIPYCSHCWGEYNKLIPLSQNINNVDIYYCATCNTTVRVLDKNNRRIN